MNKNTRWTPSTRKGGMFYERICAGHTLRVYWVTEAARWQAWLGCTSIGYFCHSTQAKLAVTKAAKRARP